jgi:hypothetical protein
MLDFHDEEILFTCRELSMTVRYSLIVFFTCLLLANPLKAPAQTWQEQDRLQPDYSGGFHRPDREDRRAGLPREEGNRSSVNSWRQLGVGGEARPGWVGGRANTGEGAPVLRRIERQQERGTAGLRRWRADAVVQGSGDANLGDKEEGRAEQGVGERLPAPRGPVDPRRGYGAVLKGRTVTPAGAE